MKKTLVYFLFLSFLFTVSSFCFGGLFAHAEVGHEREHSHVIGEEGMHFSQANEECCEHERDEFSDAGISLHKEKIAFSLFLFFIDDFSLEFRNNLTSYVHTSSLSPPPEKIALSTIVKRE